MLLGGSWMRIDSIIYIEETEKACDSECIWRLVLNSYVYLNKYIKRVSCKSNFYFAEVNSTLQG